MTNIELNSILFYADFLSLQKTSHPVTDNCKYFFVFGCPINSAYLLDLEPEYDQSNPYLLQAYQDYNKIKEQYSEEAVHSFLDDICFIRACGMVDAERMLSCIHMFSTKVERKQAFKEYREWKQNRKYTHTTLDEHGNPQQTECTQYVAHTERLLKRRGIYQGPESHREPSKDQIN